MSQEGKEQLPCTTLTGYWRASKAKMRHGMQHDPADHQHTTRILLAPTKDVFAVPTPRSSMLLMTPGLLVFMLSAAAPGVQPAAAAADMCWSVCSCSVHLSLHQCCSSTAGAPPWGTVALRAAHVAAASLPATPAPSGAPAMATLAATDGGSLPKCWVDHMPRSCKLCTAGCWRNSAMLLATEASSLVAGVLCCPAAGAETACQVWLSRCCILPWHNEELSKRARIITSASTCILVLNWACTACVLCWSVGPGAESLQLAAGGTQGCY